MNNRIAEMRKARALSLETFADQSGISERMARAIELGECVVPVDVALRVAKTLNSTVEELFDSPKDAKLVNSRLDKTEDDVAEGECELLRLAPNCCPPKSGTRGKKQKVRQETQRIPVGKNVHELSNDLEVTNVSSAEDIDANSEQALNTEENVAKEIRKCAGAPDCEDACVGKLVIESGEPLFEVANIANGVATPDSLRRVYPPRKSQTVSSYFSRTAEEEGLALSPPELVDPTIGRAIRFFDLFCGIGGFRYAAQTVFKEMKRSAKCVLSCDSDRFVQKSYEANFGDLPCGDVATLPSEEIPDFDLLFAGFPCQAFSIIGLRKGFADETKGSLFFQIARILRDKRPRAFVLENVRQLTTHDSGRTFDVILRVLQDELGYYVDWRVLNALDCGLPQKRERVVIVGALEPFEMEWPMKTTHGKTLADILEPELEVHERYYASPTIVMSRKKKHHCDFRPAVWHENKSGIISSYPYSCALRAGASYNYLLVNGERRFTPLELLRLQGFPDSFNIVVSDAQLRKQVGNAVPVDLVVKALERFLPLVFRSKGTTRKRVNKRLN